jgi:hypothetical protein
MNDWEIDAVKLAQTGVMSWRDIGKQLGKSKSTVSDFLRKYYSEMKLEEVYGVPEEQAVSDGGYDNSRILWISDLHSPYHHKNSISFLKGLKEKYNPTRIIIGGDEADLHGLNMHGVDPDLPSAGDELKEARKFLQGLAEVFPVADILESNHTSLAYRRAFKAGISKGYMKNYNEIFGVPDTWVWHNDLMVKLPNGQDCYFCHGKSTDGLKLSRNMACNVVQGHFHSKFAIQFWSNPNNLFWSMQAGCLIDDKSMAMAYNKLTLERPIIGTGLIINSMPILEAMPL